MRFEVRSPLWIFHEAFNPDVAWVNEAKERYQQGGIGDVECKKRLIDVLVSFIEPIRQRRLVLEEDLTTVLAILREGTEKANCIANETLKLAKRAMQQNFFE